MTDQGMPSLSQQTWIFRGLGWGGVLGGEEDEDYGGGEDDGEDGGDVCTDQERARQVWFAHLLQRSSKLHPGKSFSSTCLNINIINIIINMSKY